MLRAIEQHLGGKAKVIGQGAGLHLVLELSASLKDEAEFVARAKQHGCRLLAFADFYADDNKSPDKLLIGFGGIQMDKIPQGIALLARLLN